jgi:Glycosyl hydrolases family 18
MAFLCCAASFDRLLMHMWLRKAKALPRRWCRTSRILVPEHPSNELGSLLMAYDYAGSWSTVSDDQANVYGGVITGFNTDKALAYYLEQGASASKICMGPLYGRAFTQTAGIRQPSVASGLDPLRMVSGIAKIFHGASASLTC